ncbi:MAG: hypothetical protein R3F11_00775 [Verrucomicrobiales bacterium]
MTWARTLPAQRWVLTRIRPSRQDARLHEAWWEELEPTFSQTTEIVLGNPDHPRVSLTSHDWIGDSGTPWNHRHIRDGYGSEPPKNRAQSRKHRSFWAVKVETPGTYEFELRRHFYRGG